MVLRKCDMPYILQVYRSSNTIFNSVMHRPTVRMWENTLLHMHTELLGEKDAVSLSQTVIDKKKSKQWCRIYLEICCITWATVALHILIFLCNLMLYQFYISNHDTIQTTTYSRETVIRFIYTYSIFFWFLHQRLEQKLLAAVCLLITLMLTLTDNEVCSCFPDTPVLHVYEVH